MQRVRLSKEQRIKIEDEVVERYLSGESTWDIFKSGDYPYRTVKSINDILRRRGVRIRTFQEAVDLKKTYNVNFFDVIDNCDKGYFLGLMLTDGYITKNGKQAGIDLVDEDCISYLANLIGKDYRPLKGDRPMVSPTTGKKYTSKARYRINFNDQHLIKALMRFGLVERKSKTQKAPLLRGNERTFLPCIVRGIIDGNGWVRKDGDEFFIVSGSLEFIKWVQDALHALGMIGLKVDDHVDDRSVYEIRTAKKHNIEILRNKIYPRSFGMMRKHKRIHSI